MFGGLYQDVIVPVFSSNSSKETVNSYVPRQKSHLKFQQYGLDILVQNFSESRMYFADYYNFLNKSNKSIDLDSIFEEAFIEESEKLEFGSDLQIELHNLGESAVKNLKILWKYDFSNFVSIIESFEKDFKLDIEQDDSHLDIRENPCGGAVFIPINYPFEIDFIKSGGFRKIPFPIQFVKLSLIYNYLLMDNDIRQYPKDENGEPYLLKLSAILTYQDLDGNNITQKFDYFFQMGTSSFAISQGKISMILILKEI